MSNEQHVKRRLAAIMFSDIYGYSKLMDENETAALEVVRLHNRLADKAVAECDGKIIKRMGDGLLLEFSSAVSAVECAMLMQYSLQNYNAEPDSKYRFQIRIGVHLGDVVVSGDDIHGDGVNVASRIEPLAPPGGICISQDVYNLVHNKVELQFVSIGPQQLKNIARQIEIYRVLVAAADAKNIDAVSPLTSVVAAGKKKHLRAWMLIIGVVFVILILLRIALNTKWKREKHPATVPEVKTREPVRQETTEWKREKHPAIAPVVKVGEPVTQGTLVFWATDATLNGNMRRVDNFGVSYWIDGEVFWKDQKIVPGKYKVFITYSVDGHADAGGAYTITVGETILECFAQHTGGWWNPKTIEVGQVVITQELVTVKVSASTPRKTWLMGLRNVQLTRIN